MAWALVTGGTSGIGLAFVHALARHGMDIVLVARDQRRLDEVADDVRTLSGVAVETISADLADPEATARVAARLTDPSHPVDICINNAGVGLHASLLSDDVAQQRHAMAIMVDAVLVLSNAAARAMAARGRGTIINVASASAWIYTGNYSAIKRWVVSYTQALALELSGTGVQATAVCPGWVKTAFHERSGVERPHLPGFLWVKADEVARTALRDAAAGRAVSVPTLKWRIGLFIAQHGPAAIPVAVSRAISGSRR
ncbi:MAG: SDR family NAD(P)-dependent oxidoreductase [Propionibacteriaceae bacterium]|nr:SDR family NAD(P)-dependent oxidoreductase [Propionibacteriaceae bacterium]